MPSQSTGVIGRRGDLEAQRSPSGDRALDLWAPEPGVGGKTNAVVRGPLDPCWWDFVTATLADKYGFLNVHLCEPR